MQKKKFIHPPPPKYVIEDLLTKGRLHLIGGPSGSGKTTLMFQMYRALTAEPSPEPFLGRQTSRVKWAYVSGDRTAESVYETQRRLETPFPVFSLVDENLIGEDLTTKIIPRLTEVYGYRPDFIYIDGFTALCPGGHINNYAVVSKWLGQLQRYCQRKGITILGACHTTKTKEGEKFLNPRQRIAGSVAWAGFSETIIIIEPVEEGNDDRKRLVSLLPRNHQSESMTLMFNEEGQLTIPEKVLKADSLSAFVIDGVMSGESKIVGDKLDYSRLLKEVTKKGGSRRSFDRYLAKQVAEGRLVREAKGVYVIGDGTKPQAEASEETEGTEGISSTVDIPQSPNPFPSQSRPN